MTTLALLRLRAIIALTRWLISSDLAGRVAQLIREAVVVAGSDWDGPRKKAWVLDQLRRESLWIRGEIQRLPGYMLSLIVEVFVADAKTNGDIQ